MLINLQIKNYKSIQDTGPIVIKPLTFFTGPNSSGKSSILQVLLLLKQTIENKDIENPLDINGGWIQLGSYPEFIHRNNSSKNLSISAEFAIRKIRLRREIEKRLLLQITAIFSYDPIATKINLSKYTTSLDDSIFIIKKAGSRNNYKLLIMSKKKGKAKTICNVRPIKFYDFRPSIKQKIGSLSNIYYKAFGLRESGFLLEEEVRSFFYLGPLREYPHRYYPMSGKAPYDVGIKGELSVEALWHLKSSGTKDSKKILNEVEKWLKEFNFSTSAKLERISNSSIYNLIFVDPLTNQQVNIADVGFGASQTLPIILQSFISPSRSTILIEQPEIHLHPKAQATLGDLFISAVSKLDKSFIIETHSEHLLSRIRRRIAEGKISKENVAIYYFNQTSDGTEITEVTLNEDGQYIKYPDNFFEEEYNESLEHLKALHKKNVKN